MNAVGVKLQSEVKERDHLFDNMRALAMFFVVLGHLLYTFYNTKEAYGLYIAIYSFHMPLLVFISGYFAKFDIKKILTKIVLPLVVFWIIFDYFQAFVRGRSVFYISTSQPYMILWYLYSLAFWRCSVAILEHVNRKWLKIAIFVVSIILGLMIGFDKDATRAYSLSRSFVFFPFFIMGYFLKTSKFDFKKLKQNKTAVFALIGASVLLLFLLYEFKFFHRFLLFGRTPYMYFSKNLMRACFHRLLLYIFSTIVVFGIIVAMPSRKILPLSLASKYSMAIYLLHGFLIIFLRHNRYLPPTNMSILYSILITIAVMTVIIFAMWLKDKIFGYSKTAISTMHMRSKARQQTKNNKLYNWICNLLERKKK